MVQYNHRTAEMSNMDTLILQKDIIFRDRWSPTGVDTFVNILKTGNISDMKKVQIKNIAYALQYLQFLQLELTELKLHSVIEKQLYKTYIITAMSIIEVIFNYLVTSSQYCKTKEWDETKVTTNEITHNEISTKFLITMLEKSKNPTIEQMNFEELIDIVEKHRLISFRTKGYKDLKILKRIRNKVHLSADKIEDSDYLSINEHYYLFSRKYLFYILTNSKVCRKGETSHIFDFLLLSDDENRKIDTYLTDMEDENNG